MPSAMPGTSHRKPTRRAGRKAPTLRPDSNASVTTDVRVVNRSEVVSSLLLLYYTPGGVRVLGGYNVVTIHQVVALVCCSQVGSIQK